MAQPAIRDTDVHVCPAHGGEKIGAVVPLDITVNNEAGLHVGLGFTCGGQPTKITTGASTVRFHGEFAARAFDDSGHGGKLLIGSRNVVIGGPRGMGCVGAGRKLCEDAAKGRTSGQTNQSYGNCVLESVRQLLLRAGNDVSEDELVAYARAQGWYSDSGVVNGGAQQVKLLREFGIPAERMPKDGSGAQLTDVKQAISEGRGTVAFIDPHEMTPQLYPKAGNHAVLVTGVELDKDGNVTAVFINDTGAGECCKKVPGAVFASALRKLGGGAAALVVTEGAMS